MTVITAEKVAKHLADWGDYEWIDSENKVRTSYDGDVISFETWTGENRFHAVVLPGKYGEPLTEEPKRPRAVVLDSMGDIWARGDGGTWHCAIDGDDWSAWPWSDLVSDPSLSPLRLIYPGLDEDQEV